MKEAEEMLYRVSNKNSKNETFKPLVRSKSWKHKMAFVEILEIELTHFLHTIENWKEEKKVKTDFLAHFLLLCSNTIHFHVGSGEDISCLSNLSK